MNKALKLKAPSNSISHHLKSNEAIEGTHHLNPLFSFHYLTEKKYSLKDCDKETKTRLLNKIFQLSQMTWGKLIDLPREDGFEKIEIAKIKIKPHRHFTEEQNILCCRLSADTNQ